MIAPNFSNVRNNNYDNMMENLYLRDSKANYEWLKESVKQAENGQLIKFEMVEKISVIIPVYNTAEYLPKCLDSVCGQTYKNLEIICVDDGSTDGSGDIAEHYAEKDPRVQVIHKANGGESSARNVGLQHSTGEYVAFVDCDDWLEANMYEVMISAMKRNRLDMAACGYFWETEEGGQPIGNSYPVSKGVFGRKELFEYVYIRDRYRGVTSWIWCKLFHRNILYEDGKLLAFDENLRFGADLVFFIKAAVNARRICYLETAFYHYYQRANSTAHTKNLQVAFDIVTAYQRMVDYLREEQIEIQMIPWLQRFQGYRASLVAEQAIGQKDKDMLQKCQQVMRELGPVYKRTNEQYPERLQRYERLMDYQL